MNIDTNKWQSRRWERLERERYYEARLTQNLWGEWSVIRVWGRKNSRLGSTQETPVTDYAEGVALMQSIASRRRQRGYHTRTL